MQGAERLANNVLHQHIAVETVQVSADSAVVGSAVVGSAVAGTVAEDSAAEAMVVVGWRSRSRP